MRPLLFPVAVVASVIGVAAAGALGRHAGYEHHTLAAATSTQAQLPVAVVDTTIPPPERRTVVPDGGNLQAALDAARPGDTIALEAGAIYRGSFRLSQRAGLEAIVVTSSASPDVLPPANTRTGPSFARWMPVIESVGSRPVLIIPAGVSGYRFVGVEFRPQPGSFVSDLITIDASPDLPTAGSIVFDRCYLHGDPVRGGRRGIAMNGGATAVVNSYLADFKDPVNDSQALAGWGGPGPFAILNNYLEGAGENVLFGGADPSTAGMVPSDIEIRHNHFSKPLSWKVDNPAFAGSRWSIKNLLELKNARRVVIDGNIFEYSWRAAQSGFAVLFTVRNQDGAAPWSTVSDVTFTNNIVRHATSGINILGQDDIRSSQVVQRVFIGNNLFEDLGGSWGEGRLFQMLNGAEDVTFEHNTAVVPTDSFLMGGDTRPHVRTVFVNNIVQHNLYGIFGSATAVGLASVNRYFPGARVERNIIIGGDAGRYPSDQFFPATAAQVGFVDLPSRDYRLGPNSPFRDVATDGTAPGVDHARLMAATAGVDLPDARLEREPSRTPAPAPPSDDPGSAGTAMLVLAVSAVLLAWTYAGYPAFVLLWSVVHPMPVLRRRSTPTVSVLVIAHNEAFAIGARIQNLLRLDYPAGRLDITIASDGSTDDTVAIASASRSPRVGIFPFAQRRGKAAILSELVPGLTGEIVVLADTRQVIDAAAVQALVAPFTDPRVGAVSGELMLDATGHGGVGGVGGYWRYEKMIRRSESAVDSSIGATGALYALRRSLFEPIPADTILDDVLIPLRIVRRGYRVLFEPTARAFDRLSATAQVEFGRKVRTCAGNFQLLAREPWILLPWRNRLWFQTISHKVLRLMLPLLHLLTFGASLALARTSPVAAGFAGAQIAFAGLAVAGAFARPRTKGLRTLVAGAYAICLLNCAAIAGLIRFLRGTQSAAWHRTPPPPRVSDRALPLL